MSRISALVLVGLLMTASPLPSIAKELELSPPSQWVIVGAKTHFVDAKKMAKQLQNELLGVRVIRMVPSGYAVVLGPTKLTDLDAIKKKYQLPEAIFASGSNFLSVAYGENYGSEAAQSETPDQVDGGNSAGANQASAQPAAPTAAKQSSSAPVMFISGKLSRVFKNYENEDFSDRIRLHLTFRNTQPKTVVGISHTFTISNAFGEVLKTGKDNLDIRIGPNQTLESPMFYYWDDNPFIDDEVYDTLVGPLNNETYKINDVINRVIYSDGTSVDVSP